MSSDNVPMMFRAQIQDRCQIHRVEKGKRRQDAYKWVDEWVKVFPDKDDMALAPEEFIPRFGNNVETRDYKISWRLVTNSGQDEGVIRPIIGAGGFPYYSGASMKGGFLRACKQICTLEEVELYCGKKLSDGSYTQGILRFHGAYPVDMKWTKRLVDIVHSQSEKQVIEDQKTNANAQISLYKATLKFGISSRVPLQPFEWDKIWQVWERAMGVGIGSRVSAGYGHFLGVNHYQPLLQVELKGQGVTSKLVNGKKEFRCNMFKAALRGHTLRLLGGMTDKTTAQDITSKLWGGFNNKEASVGLLGTSFDFSDDDINVHPDKQFYTLSQGTLNIFCFQDKIDDDTRTKLIQTTESLIKFSLLFSSFGKSWRRICHQKFFPEYYKAPEQLEGDEAPKKQKQIIGSHWEFLDSSTPLCLNINELKEIREFINNTRNIIKTWIPENKQAQQGITKWRESWYPRKVQVWARFTEGDKSKAIYWFHQNYSPSKSIKNPHRLTGSMGKTGRIWHRMYPCYSSNANGEIVVINYIELLTIFPDISLDREKFSDDFIRFLETETDFTQVW
ncbi:hypothetical protein DSM106972_047780 [Dulcicalothrix desertica PCC 7102]|uniref:RAMP superfamily protein n=1 Tax=Dulcicalothrix desertica PCC 7102 TaxID=232991 RepID=A0A433VCP5_9CYAN|nr:hypothetical protein [Dulcicalothrix desertica]RUT03864.1 hypothetical protein DSM106972_047780 [Dulcicalothrix desertica PCC 7102]TWH43725.1 CRISPR-associated protein Cmr6 [Dulcicalothrix desertica PCC 7102]